MKPREAIPEPKPIRYDRLSLDPTNPRLAGHRVTIEGQDEILRWLWKNMAVDELVSSIGTNGYWQHEELFAADESGRLVVLEGNRRLAAVKILLDSELRARLDIPDPPTISPEIEQSLKVLPVVISSRERIWEYIGFKHVNGPQTWDSIAKAQYIHHVHTDFGVPLDQIASTIGDQHDTVVRLYRGYLVLKQAQDNELFDPDDSFRPKFPFSHLWTALGYTNVREFLALDRDQMELPNPVPEERLPALRDFLLWLYGSRSEGIQPLVQRQNPDLRNLAETLGAARGLRKLEAGLPLEVAHDAAVGDERLFADAVTNAEQHLREAKRFVATGYTGSSELLETSQDIVSLAKSLHQDMEEFRSEA